ncbi:MAG: hypothetical protein AB1566_12350 [Chloroflexota bacterium]
MAREKPLAIAHDDYQRQLAALKVAPRSEGGQSLPLVLAAFAIGALLVGVFLTYASTMLLASRATDSYLGAYYAADAGVESVLNDLVNGSEPADGSTRFLSLNGFTAFVTVTWPAGSMPAGEYRYIDPQVPSSMTKDSPLYSFRVYNVKAPSSLQVNWAFTSTLPILAGRLRLRLFDPNGDQVGAIEQSQTSPVQLRRDLTLAGLYRVEFDPSKLKTLDGSVNTQPYDPQGGTGKTWVWTMAYKDYLITSTAQNITVRCYVRQIPGRTEPLTSQVIQIYSWQVQ